MREILKTLCGVALLLSLFLQPSHAVTCTDVFSNAVGTTGGELKLDNQPKLVNTGNRVLATDDLSASGTNASKICDNSPCSASGVPASTLVLPANGSSTSYDSNPLSFSAGDYYYKDFTLSGGQSTQLIATSGTVRIHVSGKLVIDNAKANFGGIPEDLVFLVGGDVDIKGKAKVKALIYAEGKVVVTDNATHVEGAITGYDVEVKDKAKITYDEDAVDAADLGGICTGGSPISVDADGFNCVVSGGDALTGHLYLQKVGTAFGFDVVALKDSDGNGSMDEVEIGFAADADRSVTLELVDASGAAACSSRPALNPAVTQALTFTAADAGRKTAATMAAAKAYRSVSCRITDTSTSPSLTACSTDNFVIRPEALVLEPPALNNASATGTPKAVAGSAFSLSVVGGAGYTGTPKVDQGKLVAHSGAVQTGSLSGGFSAAVGAAGTATGPGFSYSEVGNFRFSAQGLYDDTFANVDETNGDCTADFSNSPVGGKYGCRFGNVGDTDFVGRFHPADFLISVFSDGALLNTCSSGGFSYQGQGIPLSSGSVFRITARNSGAGTTQNYTGAYRKLVASDVAFAAVTADASQLGADGVNPVTASWSQIGSSVLDDNGDGTMDLLVSGAEFTWGRTANDMVGPFITDLAIAVAAAQDSDDVAASGLPEVAWPTGVEMRYGRVAVVNAHGSELQHLAIPTQVQHYAGSTTGFVTNSQDACSGITLVALADLNPADGLATSETCVWDIDNDSGVGCASVGPAGSEFEPVPVAGIFNINLQAPGVGNSGVIKLTADVPAHLEYSWAGGADTDPTARATFGIYNRPTTIIYRREVR